MGLGGLRREHLPLVVVASLVLTGVVVFLYVLSADAVVEEDAQYVLPDKSKSRGIGHSWPVIVPSQDPEQWRPPVLPEHLQSVDQNDEELIQHIRENWVIPPYPLDQWALGDERRVHFSEMGQSERVDKALKGLRDGFFVECGAGDGEYLSNTLFFEKYRKWIGVLIEMDPVVFSRLIQLKRHAYMVNACISTSRTPMVMEFTRVLDSNRSNQYTSNTISIKVQCFPLTSILKAIGVYRIDYFSLDVEGTELDIIRSIPFDEFHIRSFTIRSGFEGDSAKTEQHREAIKDLLVRKLQYTDHGLLEDTDMLLINYDL